MRNKKAFILLIGGISLGIGVVLIILASFFKFTYVLTTPSAIFICTSLLIFVLYALFYKEDIHGNK